MVPWEELLFGQTGVDHGENPLITDGSLGRLDMGDQLWSLFIAGLGEMHLIPDPQRRPFLAVTGIVNARVLLRPNNFDPLLTTYTC